MGLVGRWIDTLTDDERDRIVEAQWWAYSTIEGDRGDVDHPDATCLVVHAGAGVYPDSALVWQRFDRLCDRFGLPRIVKACKQRAGHRPPVHEMSEEGERNGPGAWPVTANPKGV